MRVFIFIYFLFLYINNLYAQIDRDLPEDNESISIVLKQNVIYGKLIDSSSGRGIEYASVQLFVKRKYAKDSLVNAMLSLSNGDFRFTNITPNSEFKIIFSAAGYDPVIKEILFKETSSKNNNIDLGNIILATDIQVLKGVVIQTRKSALELGVDGKVFNVDKSLISVGGTAVDLMRNIPTLSVDIDGNVELRNSTPQIFVDGRPTILTLDQIPADNIEKVELITNPSAKYDAASSGGIINIVLKKNKRVGLNGVITAGIGTPKIYNSNLNLNLREGKFNFYASGGFNKSGGIAKGETRRENKENGITDNFFNQDTRNDRNSRFLSFRFGVDYFIDNRNTLGITHNFSTRKYRNYETQEQEYLNSNKLLEYFGKRDAEGASTNHRSSTGISYKHNFPEKSKELTADINYNYGPGSENSFINNTFYYPNGSLYEEPTLVRSNGNNDNDQVTFQIDFVNPIGEHKKIETGFRSYYNKYKSLYDAFAIDNGQEIKLSLSNNYQYTEKINALYFTYAGKKNKISYKIGVRAEYSKFDGELIDSSFKFGYEYPAAIKNLWDAFFPSASFSKEISEDDQFQINFTRRIRRPRFWQLNPFIDINDPSNLRQGNPSLRPEFINSFEVNYNKNYKSGNFLASIYFRSNPDDITQYSDTITAAQYAQLDNAAVDPNAILNTYINANTTKRYGAEFTLQQKIGENFELTPSLDLQYRTVNATINDLDLSNKGFSWEAKLTASYKIATSKKSFFNNMSFQFLGEYESPEVIPQGKRDAQYQIDLAMRKDFLKNKKATITFAVNDMFNTNRYGVIYDTERFYQTSYRRRNVRNIRLSFSYKFGDANFSLFRKGNDRNRDDD